MRPAALLPPPVREDQGDLHPVKEVGSVQVQDEEERLRQSAVTRLKKRHDFKGHLLIYTLVNAFIVVIWAITDPHGFFWPIFPMVGWGIGVVMNAWDVYGSNGFDENDVRREMDRLRDR